MSKRFHYGLDLIGASWTILSQHKRLFLLPVLSGLTILLTVFAWFGFSYVVFDGAAVLELLTDPEITEDQTLRVVGFVTVVAQFLSLFIALFFNSALVYAANELLDGREVTLSQAIRAAGERFDLIFKWALAVTLYRLIIERIRRKLRNLGPFAVLTALLADTAFLVVTFLVLPILVIEQIGPVDAVKRSIELLRTSWGEGLTGHIGLGMVNAVALFGFFVVSFLVLMAGPFFIATVWPVALLLLMCFFIVTSSITKVFQTVLYRHATGQPVGAFDLGLIHGAFKTRGLLGYRGASGEEAKRLADGGGYSVPNKTGAGPVDLGGPQDWSKLPDEWTV